MQSQSKIISFARVKCEIHGGKLRDCGCDPFLWADRDWMHERSLVRMRRLGALYRLRYEQRMLEAMFGPNPLASPVGSASSQAPCNPCSSSSESD